MSLEINGSHLDATLFDSLSIDGVSIHIFRDDLNHAKVSGNKLHKLKPNLELAKSHDFSTIASFGGPYSNHLHALAWACKENGLNSVGIVRGELHTKLTPTLNDCQEWGMRLIACQRKDYRAIQERLTQIESLCAAHDLPQSVFKDLPAGTMVIPEGGSNVEAIDSIRLAYKNVFESASSKQITHAICATGTGATLAGLYKAAPKNVDVIGIQAVSEGDATLNRIHQWVKEKPKRLTILPGHMGGFGKSSAALTQFIEQFDRTHHIPLDFVYNGKALFKISEMIRTGQFKKGDQVLYIHTGGLQCNRS